MLNPHDDFKIGRRTEVTDTSIDLNHIARRFEGTTDNQRDSSLQGRNLFFHSKTGENPREISSFGDGIFAGWMENGSVAEFHPELGESDKLKLDWFLDISFTDDMVIDQG
ncbi:MAG: hypothetical protein AAF514_23175 [Verrucomicrobiota bacterium]